MVTRSLSIVRHGEADAWGNLTERGRRQSALVGERLARSRVPVDVVWHSPLPRAADSARLLADRLGPVLVDEAPELVDHVPYVPSPEHVTASWAGFFDGYGHGEAAEGQATARSLTARFGPDAPLGGRSTHEVLVTHAYPAAWLVREALAAPPERWMSLAGVANGSLTVITYVEDEAPAVAMVNDLSHLPAELRWTGFPHGGLP